MLHLLWRWLLASAFFLCAPLAAQPLVIDVGSPSESVCGGTKWLIPVSLLPPGTTDVTLRFGADFSCRIPVALGSYSVTLRFQEPAVPGDTRIQLLPRRIFGAVVNGVTVFAPMDDPFASALTASRTVEVSTADGWIVVRLTATVRAAVLSSVEITPVASNTGSSRFADAEIPTGPANGQNATFLLLHPPSPLASLQLFRNGLLQRRGLDFDGLRESIQFRPGAIPEVGDTLQAFYRW